jgi:hypothetical protein
MRPSHTIAPASAVAELAELRAASESDAAVIERSRRDPERLTEAFDRHYAEIDGYVSRRLGASLADDVASETFLTAFARRRRTTSPIRTHGRGCSGSRRTSSSATNGPSFDRRRDEGEPGGRGAADRGGRRPARPAPMI